MNRVVLFVDRQFGLHARADIPEVEATWSPMPVDGTSLPHRTVLKVDSAGRLFEQTYRPMTPDDCEICGGLGGRNEIYQSVSRRQPSKQNPLTFELLFENGRCAEKRLCRHTQPNPDTASPTELG